MSWYCDYLNRRCDGMTQYEKSCAYCASYRYNVVIPNKYNDDDAFDKARDNDEPRFLKKKYEPFVRHEPDKSNTDFIEKMKLLSVKEYHAACREYESSGGHPHDHQAYRSFLFQKAQEKENQIMAKKTETTALTALQGLNESQIAIVTQHTPKHLIKQRKGRGGKVFDYLPHAEVAKILNNAFNHSWSFTTEPILQFCNDHEMTVKGVLIVHGIDGKTITKEQYGSQDILKDKQGNPSVSYGDALKGAASDALKKCASLLGIALDLYANGHKYVDPEPESVTPTPEPVKTEPIKEPEPVKAMTPDKITDSQKDLIQKLIKSHVFSDTERAKAISFYEKSDCTKEKADKFIKSLQSHIEIRKESEKTEKESLMKQVMGFRDTDSERFNKAMADFKKAYNTDNAVEIEHFNHILAFRNNGNQQAAA